MVQHFVLFGNSNTLFLGSLFSLPLDLLLQVTGRIENLGTWLGCLWWNRQFQTPKASGSGVVRCPFKQGVVSKETVVLRQWGSETQKFGFIN